MIRPQSEIDDEIETRILRSQANRSRAKHPKRFLRLVTVQIPAMPADDRRIIKRISERTGVSIPHILSPSRGRKQAVHARQEVMWLLRRGGKSYGAIGRLLAGRDQSTIRYGVIQHILRTGVHERYASLAPEGVCK